MDYISRFESKFSKGRRCWNWTAGVDSKGYGVFSLKQRATAAHRLAYRIYRGRIPIGMCVLHTCDNPRCVNPSHLWIGTKAENNADRKRKGRNAKNVKFPDRRGSLNERAKLTERDVLQIRASRESTVSCGARYGVSHVLISQIRRRKIWRHI